MNGGDVFGFSNEASATTANIATPAPTAGPTPSPTPVSPLGDVNGDGLIDIVDALKIAYYNVGLSTSDFNPANADVNDDGEIHIVDAMIVARYYVGLKVLLYERRCVTTSFREIRLE
jgi:hypothetical protein